MRQVFWHILYFSKMKQIKCISNYIEVYDALCYLLTSLSRHVFMQLLTYKSTNRSFIIGTLNRNCLAGLNKIELGRMIGLLQNYKYLGKEYRTYNHLVSNALLILSAISFIIKLKLLHDDFLLKVDLIEINARAPRVIIVFAANLKLRVRCLNTMLISNFRKIIGVIEYFRYNTMR